VLLLALLHFTDTDNPVGITATLARASAPGSYVAISHLTADFAPGPVSAG
jgi:S-adenosyl methyltransferase